MKEYFTEALVLDIQEKGEFDSSIIFYTRDFGRITARAKSIKKIISKSAGHLQPLNFANVRFIEKNGFQVIDALTSESCVKLKSNPDILTKFLNIAKFIKDTTFDFHPDYRFWLAIKKVIGSDFDEKTICRFLLKIMGFDPEFASCFACESKDIKFFLKNDHCFSCQKCALKAPEDEVILIK